MEALQTRLERLDKEVDELTSDMKEAWTAYENATEPEQRSSRKELWQQLVKEKEVLIQQRQALQVKLGAPGLHTHR